MCMCGEVLDDRRRMGDTWTTHRLGLTLALMILLIQVSQVQCRTSQGECGANEHSLDGERCCSKCPPGRGMSSPCTLSNDTHCEACVYGQTFSSELSHTQPCKPCSICPEYAHIRKVCNATHDTVCQCDQNYFYDKVSRRCRHCDLCPVGYGVRKHCTRENNTLCAMCPPGTYSEYRGKERCKTCSMCKVNQVMLQICSSGQNTVCIDLPESFGTGQPDLVALGGGGVGDMVTVAGLPEPVEDSSHTNVIPIYCAVLGLLVVGLIIFVVVTQRRRRIKLAQARKAELALRSGSPSREGLMSPPPGSKAGGPPRSNTGQGADAGVYTEQDCRPLTSMCPIQEIPDLRFRVLETMLQGGRDGQSWWSKLARDLGYNSSQIASIEVRSQQERQSALRFLMLDYSRQEDATVGTLVDALRDIGREDAVQALYGELRDYAPAPRYVDLGTLKGQII